MSGPTLGNIADPLIDLGLDPNRAFRDQRPRSRKPAVVHALVDCRSLETDPGDDLGQAEKSSVQRSGDAASVVWGITSIELFSPYKLGPLRRALR